MALIATQILRQGFVIAALPGNVVAPEAVEQWGWQDGVKDDGKDDGNAPQAPSVQPDAVPDPDLPAGAA